MKIEGLKHDSYLYVDSGFFGADMDDTIVNQNEKLVKVRKDHTCCNCQEIIPKGDYAVRNTALIREEGYASCYICKKCVEDWLEESCQVDLEED